MSDKETADLGVLEDVLRARGVRLPTADDEPAFTAVGPPEDPESVIQYTIKQPVTIVLPKVAT